MVRIMKDTNLDPYDPDSSFMMALRRALAPVECPDGPMVWDTRPATDDSSRLLCYGTTDDVLEAECTSRP